MAALFFLYAGTILLMYLSQIFAPGDDLLARSRGGSFLRYRADLFLWGAILWLTFFMALRTRYNDTETYIKGWRESESIASFLQKGELWNLTGNPLSDFWRTLSHEWFPNYHIYFLLPAFLVCFASVKLFKTYSVNPPFSMLIFLSIGTYIMYMAALKQCLAMFFLLMSIPYVQRKEYGKFYALVCVAILFHAHAFMFLIVPALCGKPWGKTTWLGLVAVLFAMATYDRTLGAFMGYAQSVGALIVEEELFDGHAINTLRVVVYWIPAIIALLFRRRLFYDSTRTENLIVNMSIVSAFILTIGLVQAANLFARMAAYFEIMSALALPWMIQKLFVRRSANVVTFLAGICYLGYFLYEFGISKDFGSSYSAISLWQFVQELLAIGR